MKIIDEEKATKLRLVEIDNYYTEKYNYQTKIMKTIIFICIPIIILAILANKNILPQSIYAGLVAIILIIGLYFLIRQLISANVRSPMNYQQYIWYFNNANAAAQVSSSSSTTPSSSTDPWTKLGSCIGQQCCSTGMTYDASLNYCVVSSNTST